jgi:hypothetical protein
LGVSGALGPLVPGLWGVAGPVFGAWVGFAAGFAPWDFFSFGFVGFFICVTSR